MKVGFRSCTVRCGGQALTEYALLLVMVFALGAVGLAALGRGAKQAIEGACGGVIPQPSPTSLTTQGSLTGASGALAVASATSVQAAAMGRTFYVDAQAGADTRSGLSPDDAWRTIAKVNQTGFAPGDSILLKRGCQWREQLTAPSPGAAGAAIRFGAYGTGARPRLNGSDPITGWSRYATNVWTASVSAHPTQVLFEGARGIPESVRSALDAPRKWYWEAGKLYVYSTSDPAIAFPTQGVEATVRSGAFAWQKSYLAFEEIEFTRGAYGLYVGGGSSNVSCTSVEASLNFYDGLMVDGQTCSAVTFDGCLSHDNARHGVMSNSASGVAVRGGRYYANAAQYGAGIGFNGARGGSVSGVEATGNFYGIKAANGAGDVLISGNNVHGNLNFGIDLDSGAQRCTAEKNQVYGNGSHGIAVEYNSSGCTVARNLCYANGPQHAGIFVEMSSNVVVDYNVVCDEYIGIRFNAQATGCAAYNNVAYNVGGVAFSAFNNCSSITFENNIAFVCDYLMVHVRPDSQAGFRSDHNNWCANGAQLVWGWDPLSFAQWQSATGQDAGSLAADPMFASAGAGDFQLQAGSPCVDAGASLGLTADYEGDQVPQGAAPDIGAFEGSGTSPAVRHDVAVISVSAPSPVNRGEHVAVSVQVANTGEAAETFNVTLTESPDGATLGTKAVSALAPGASTNLTFDWDTAAASAGAHTLTAAADMVAGETNAADNAAQTSVTVQVPLPALHVASVNVTAQRKPSPARATAVVTIADEAGAAVAAIVSGTWSGAAAGAQSAVTNGTGQATFSGTKSRSGNTFIFTVTNVTKDGYRYDPSQNVETSDSAVAR
jgi:parallel beta-helix repeat protein